MPELSLVEAILGFITAASAGGTAAVLAKRPRPGTPEDHELRIVELERSGRDGAAVVTRVTALEGRAGTIETRMAEVVGRLTESNDRIWHALESAGDKLDQIHRTVIRLDVETGVEREIRRSSSPNMEKPR